MPVTIGNLIGTIIGAGEGEVVMQQNVSICQSIVTSCFDWRAPRNKLVTDGLNFPSNNYIYHSLERAGARVVTVPSPDGFTLPVEHILAAIDEETALVSVSHVAFRSSYVQDLAAITQRAHAVGAMVVADLYQSAGTLPVDVRALAVDFATGGSVKWLCGGPGAGYLYVRRDLWETLSPAATGWMAHEEPFAFAPGPIQYTAGIYRFLNGTPNVPAMYSARGRVTRSSTRSASPPFGKNPSARPRCSSNSPMKPASPSTPAAIPPSAAAPSCSMSPMATRSPRNSSAARGSWSITVLKPAVSRFRPALLHHRRRSPSHRK